MAKISQNLVILIEPSRNAYDVSYKAGNMCFNRFTIDENAAFEFSGVYYLKKSANEFKFEGEVERTSKGKGYLILQ